MWGWIYGWQIYGWGLGDIGVVVWDIGVGYNIPYIIRVEVGRYRGGVADIVVLVEDILVGVGDIGVGWGYRCGGGRYTGWGGVGDIRAGDIGMGWGI